MSSKETILQTIELNKPSFEELPLMDFNETIHYDDIIQQFIKVLNSIGGYVVYLDSQRQLLQDIQTEKETGKFIINRLGNEEDNEFDNWKAPQLETLHKCYLRSYLGVAENGAVWLAESQMANRLSPFICQHLVIVLKLGDIVSTMHQAYRQVNTEAEGEGFGVFIAGPSKTADIEQNLVIGAHGARSLTVYLIDNFAGKTD